MWGRAQDLIVKAINKEAFVKDIKEDRIKEGIDGFEYYGLNDRSLRLAERAGEWHAVTFHLTVQLRFYCHTYLRLFFLLILIVSESDIIWIHCT
jgi:hypothetical protein